MADPGELQRYSAIIDCGGIEAKEAEHLVELYGIARA